MTDLNLVVKVQREGGKGWHWIDKAKYEADPGAYVLLDDDGNPVARDPLDHDGDGKKGGTKAEPKDPELNDLRKQYEETFGKKPFGGWDADKLRAKLAAGPQE